MALDNPPSSKMPRRLASAKEEPRDPTSSNSPGPTLFCEAYRCCRQAVDQRDGPLSGMPDAEPIFKPGTSSQLIEGRKHKNIY